MSIIGGIGRGVNTNGDSEFEFEDDEFQTQYPGIYEALARRRYEGADRETGRLVVYAEAGRASLCLIDRQTGMVAFFASNSITEALSGLENALQKGAADWRKDKRGKWRSN